MRILFVNMSSKIIRPILDKKTHWVYFNIFGILGKH